jgi:hypothetical protein
MTQTLSPSHSTRRTQRLFEHARPIAVLLGASLIVACSSSTEGPIVKKDSGPDSPKDTHVNKDLGPDIASTVACTANGQTYTVGQTVVLPGDCPVTCKCFSTGLGQCASACGPVDGAGDVRRDGPPLVDVGVMCTRAGRAYVPGETIPLNDGCGGSCVCLVNGTIGACTGACPPDSGADVPLDAGPDQQLDRGPDHYDYDLPPEAPPIDTACTVGTRCNQATGGQGLCIAGTCKACAGAQDDTACATMYGAGTICSDGQCVAGTCHDSTVCPEKKVCDATHTCRACASDLQCQNDAAYGRGSICLGNGQCVAGTCHTSTDCLGKKLCDAAVHTCNNCSADSQCQADTVYGAKSVCVSSQCVAGTCAATADCKSMGRLCPSATKVCTQCTADSQCRNDTAYGSGTICVDGQCVSGTCSTSSGCPNGRVCNTTSRACVLCQTDTQCRNDAVYGQHTLCLSGACTTGDCHDISSDCSAGRLCGSTVPHACGDCSTDAQCRGDARYGAGTMCVGNLCVPGDCHDTSNDCTSTKAGQVCGARTPHTCGTCLADEQCKNDAKYGANTICATTAGLTTTGQCVSNACSNTGKACAANGSDVCCAAKCVAGNCCGDADCQTNTAFGDSYFCRQNTCSRCDNATGNAYLVDPVNGDDGPATGSGAAAGVATAGCSFRTLTRALQVIGTAPAGTTITIVGRTAGTTSLYTVAAAGDTSPVESLPIQVPANVTITSKTGAIKLTLGNNKVGFSLLGDKANLRPIVAAPLTIDGANRVSAAGIVVAAGTGTAGIANVTVTNTGDDGIQVTGGTAQIGSGVRVTGAGTAAARQSGLLVSGGTAAITVAAADPATSFESNTQSGIAVTGAGVLHISGAAVTGGSRSVLVQNNVNGNIDFAQTPVAATSAQGAQQRIPGQQRQRYPHCLGWDDGGDQQPGEHRLGYRGRHGRERGPQPPADPDRFRSQHWRRSVRGAGSRHRGANPLGGRQPVRGSGLHDDFTGRAPHLDELHRRRGPRHRSGGRDHGDRHHQQLHPALACAARVTAA